MAMTMAAMMSHRMKVPKVWAAMVWSSRCRQPKVTDLNLRVCSVSAFSVGRRSIEDAP